MSDGAFTRRGAGILAAVAAASLAAAAFLSVFGDALYDPPSFAQDAFSRSAVGHHAAVELLRRLGWQVVVSRNRTPERGRDGALVALLEPRVGPDDGIGAIVSRLEGRKSTRSGTLEAVNTATRWVLVVLPKRLALPDNQRPRFVAMAEPLPIEDAQRVLDALELDAKVVRPEQPIASWKHDPAAFPADPPLPDLERPQLLTSSHLKPLVWADGGMLAGEVEAEGEWRTIVLADPDVVATHGLGRGGNAALLVRLLERLGAGDRTIVVDETLHGLEEQPSLARSLFRFPLVLATVSAVLAAALLAWAASVRFGRPRPPDPLLSPGKLFLVEQTAGLLRHGGRAGDAAAAYLRAAKDEVVQRLRPPGEAAAGEAWLARAEAARGAEGELAALEERVRRLSARRAGGEDEAVRIARDIHEWREELTDGARTDPRHDRRAQG